MKKRGKEASPTQRLSSAEPTPNLLSPRQRPRSLQEAWDEVWFTPISGSALSFVQPGVGLVSALWFLSLLSHGSFWWGDQGFNASQFASQLESATEGSWSARWRLSPLWSSDQINFQAIWCSVGVVLSALSAFRVGGRWLRVSLAIWILLLAQRLSWSAGSLEPLLVAINAYLAVAQLRPTEHWSNQFGARLIQVHVWLLFCAALVNQLAFESWWQGESVWWLASSGHSNLLSTEWLEGRLLLVNALTHAITLASLFATVCLWPFSAAHSVLRCRIGLVSAGLLAGSYALVADQFLYGLLLAVCLSSFAPRTNRA